jgi:soluble lytic murein transglycosylase-like protein
MVTQRDTQRRAQPQGQKEQELRMRPAKRQLLNENSLPIPSIPPTVVPPPAVPSQRSQPTSKNDLPYPPHVPPLNAEGNPMGHLVPNVPAAEPSMLRDRYNSNNPYVVEATRLAKKYGLPENIFLALIHQESRFDANALSPAGAIGLTQLMPGTASDMGVDPRDPMQNLEGGARYLAQQYKAFGEWPLALAAYNAGPSRVRKAGNVIPNNKETQDYVPTVLHNAGVAGYADGGLIELARKYADGGSVAGAAQVYDPAVIAAIAASIVEPQGYADGGTATGVSSDDAAPAQERVQDQRPRTFADLVRRYAVGDAMQMGAPLDDPSLGAGVSQSIGSYLRPVVQGNFEIPGTVKKYAIDVATGPKPFTRLGSDIGTFGSAVWEGVKNDPVGAVLDILPVVSNVRSGMDAHELRNRAVEAEQAGDEDRASMYRQFSALGAAGAIPLVGYGAIAARRAANAARDAAARRAGAGAGTALVVRGGVDDIGSGVGLIAREDAAAAAGARGTQAIARDGAEGVTAGTDVVADVVAREGVGLEPSGAVARRAKAAARESAQAVAVVPRELSPLGFYSHGAETAANLSQAKGTPDQMAAMLRKYGVKPDEFYNTGIADETATNVMRSKIERDYAPKLAAAKLEMDALGLNENTINKKSPDYNRALEIRDSPETKAKYQYDRTLSAMRSEMDSAMVLRPEWASRPSVTREELAQHFSERRPQVEETVLGKTTKGQPYPEEYTKIEQDIQSRYLDEIRRLRSVHLDNAEDWSVRTEAAKKAQDLYDEMDLKINEAIPNREALIRAARDRTTPTKFQRYTLPGGENYREVLLHLPENKGGVKGPKGWGDTDGGTSDTANFRSTHWDDPNVLAHLRMSDRTGPNGEKILHLEEIQSDWGQKGRTEGFADPKPAAQWDIDVAAVDKVWTDALRERTYLFPPSNLEFENFYGRPDYQAVTQRIHAARDAFWALGPRPTDSGIPPAPYVTNTAAWTDLALKRALKEAAEGGYDRIVWTPGAEQAKRYSLFDKPREGMMNYYDKMVPNQLSKLVKRLDPDAKVGLTDVMLPQGTGRGMGHNNPPFEAPGLTITPKMREAIMKGQTDFAEGGHVQGYADGGSADNSLAALYEKYYGEPTTRISYAQGGSVDSAAVYDPAVIAAIAASITEDDHA